MRWVSFWLAIGIFGAVFPAAADNLSIYNCSEGEIALKLYNEKDGLCWVERYSFSLPKCSFSVTYTCDGPCKVSPLGSSCLGYAKLSGQWVVKKGNNITGGIAWFESTEAGAQCAVCP
jgi:hypothetical protein